MKTVLGICKFCQKYSELQNSHIIPEIFYDLLYDESPRRFYLISADSSKKIKYEQQGIREHLLCKSCEGRFQKYEDYVKRAFIDGKIVNGKKLQAVQMKDYSILQNLDYQKFKLFLLSLLWRMSVASRDFFVNVDLGQIHEEKILNALLDENPLQPEAYPCIFEFLTLGGKFYQDFMLKPYCLRGAFRIYSVIITGIRFSFFVGACAPPKTFLSMSINQQNELIFGHTEIRDDAFLYDALLKFGKRNDLSNKKQH